MTDYKQKARDRVLSTPALRPHAETILAGWWTWGRHWEWVVETETETIVEWAEWIERSYR